MHTHEDTISALLGIAAPPPPARAMQWGRLDVTISDVLAFLHPEYNKLTVEVIARSTYGGWVSDAEYWDATLVRHGPEEGELEMLDLLEAVPFPVATQAAEWLRGKHKRFFTPAIDCGDFVVVTNAAKVKLTGNKIEQKFYFSHSGYAKGAKVTPIKLQMERDPRKVVMLAVKRMLQVNRLRGKLGREVIETKRGQGYRFTGGGG